MHIVEIFTSIQGEGVNLGRRANFIRFAGCNLNCTWCDTAWQHANADMSIPEIVEAMDKNAKLVVITGGEPLLQKNLLELIEALQLRGFEIAIETNGTLSTSVLRSRGVHIACSPKPQAGWRINPCCEYDELKYVVDGQLCVEDIRLSGCPIWLQPEGSNMQNAWKDALFMQERLLKDYPYADVRVGVQLHKIMEVR